MNTDEADAWIWAAIAMATKRPGDPINWAEVIGAADAINHVIPRNDEIEHAVDRLSRAGLLTIDGDKVTTTSALHDAYSAARGEARDGMFDVALQLVKRLPGGTTTTVTWKLAPGMTENAYWNYTQQIAGSSRGSARRPDDESYVRSVLRKARTFKPAVLSWYRMADNEIDESDQERYFKAVGRTILGLAQREWIVVGECRPASSPQIERELSIDEVSTIFGPQGRWWEYETTERWVGVECTDPGLRALEDLTNRAT